MTCITALIKVANGMAKNTPQKNQSPPNTTTDKIITNGCKLTASENKMGTTISCHQALEQLNKRLVKSQSQVQYPIEKEQLKLLGW